MNDGTEKKRSSSFIFVCLLAIFVFCIGCYILFYNATTTTETHSDVRDTIQRIEMDSERIGNEINNAGTALDRGQGKLTDAQETTGRLQDSADTRSELLGESKDLIQRLKDQFAEIDRTNGSTGTQNTSKGTTE